MIDIPVRFLRELVGVFLDASPYILLGFSVAACIQVLLPVSAIQRLFGKGRVRSIFAASLLGIPLPLCSCSVLPTAIALRKRGAGRGATLSFLVSTPETGIDSIALTYGLMDPLMAIYRPFAALVSALSAGFAAEIFGKDEDETEKPEEGPPDASCGCPAPAPASGADAGEHSHDKLAQEEARVAAGESALPIHRKLAKGFRGAFVEIFDETSHWMLGGLVISALISVLLPATIVTRYLSSGAVPLFLMLVIGIPIYICASASTPIAAALVLKGLSPGAALVFLLAGPATNIGSLAIIGRFLGRRVTVIYLATLAVLSLVLGAALDFIYPLAGIEPGGAIAAARQLPAWFTWPSAAVFLGLLFFSFRRVAPPSEFRRLGGWITALIGFRITPRLAGRLGALVLVGWIVSGFFFQVPPGHRGLVRRFGAPHGDPRGEGLHLRWPSPIESIEVLSVDGVRRIELGFRSPGDGGAPLTMANVARELEEESLFLTGDENLLAMTGVVQYRVLDPERWRYGFSDPQRVVKTQAISELLDVLAVLSIDGVYTDQRREVEARVRTGLERRVVALDLGIEIIHYGVKDVHAPPEVHAAFRDVASSQEDKQTSINVALRYLDETVNLARGEAARDVSVAESFSVQETKRAEGGAVSLKARADAYGDYPVGTYTRLYLETMETVLMDSRKIVRPGGSGGGKIDLWISAGTDNAANLDDVLRGSQARREPRTENGK